MAAKNKVKLDAGPLDTKQVTVLEHNRELFPGRFSPDGKFIFAGSYDGNIYRWEVGAEFKKVALTGHHGWIQGLAFHPDGKRLFTGDSWGGICCWNYADAEPKPLWTRENGHPNWMRCLALSSDGKLLATCGADFVFRVWSAEDGSLKWESPVQETDLHTVIFHPKDGALLVGDLRGNVTQWDIQSHKMVRKLDAKILYARPMQRNNTPDINEVGGVRCMAFSPDSKTLACCGCQPTSSGFFTGKPAVVLIDWETGKTTHVLQGDGDIGEGMTHDVIWHPDGYLMATCCGQAGKGAIYFWKPAEKSPFYVNKNLNSGRGMSVSVDVDALRIAFTQTNSSGGNGRAVTKDGEYIGGIGRIHVFEATKI